MARTRTTKPAAHKRLFTSTLVIIAVLTVLLLLLLYPVIMQFWTISRVVLFAIVSIALLIVLLKVIPYLENKKVIHHRQIGLVARIIIIILLVLALIFLVLNVMVLFKVTPSITIGGMNVSYVPGQSKRLDEYMRVYGFFSSPYEVFPKSLSEKDIETKSLSDKVKTVKLPNSGFELDENNDGMPDYWYKNGNMSYTSTGCFSGNKCIYEQANMSDNGWLQLNSEEIKAVPGQTYAFPMMVNCLECNNSAYLGVFWMKHSVEDNRSVEFGRNILVLNSTKGYEQFTLTAIAPLDTETAIFGVRVHTEGTKLQPLTRLYLDN